MSDSPPQPKTTVAFEKPPTWAIEMGKNIADVKVAMGTLSNEFNVLRVDVQSLQQWRLDEERRRVHLSSGPPPLTSQRVREVIELHPSQLDLDTQSQLASEIVARQLLAEKVDDLTKTQAKQLAILTRLDGFATAAAKHPMVRKVAYAAGGAILAWLASKGHVLP